jgi:hypothetical protein
VDGLGNNNLIEVIMVALMKCGRLTREEVAKKLLCFGVDGVFGFAGGGGGGCLGTIFNGCPLCGSPD